MKKRKKSKKSVAEPEKPAMVFNCVVDNPVDNPVDKMLKTYADPEGFYRTTSPSLATEGGLDSPIFIDLTEDGMEEKSPGALLSDFFNAVSTA